MAPRLPVPIKTRLDPKEADALRLHAKAEGRSVAGQVAYLIRQYLDGQLAK